MFIRQAMYRCAPRFGIRAQACKSGGISFKTKNPQIWRQSAGKNLKQPNSCTYIHYAVTTLYRDSVPKVFLLHKNLFVCGICFISVQMCHWRTVRQQIERLVPPKWLTRALWNYISDQLLATRPILSRQDQRLSHAALLSQSSLDFAKFNPVAMNLDLIVNPAAELDISVR